MNEEPTNPPNSNTNTAFSQQSNTQTNPFTGDLKGEFSSDFGTNTNAVSQIFKSSGFASGDRSKTILIGVAVVGIVAAAYFLLNPSDDADSGLFSGEEQISQQEEIGDEADEQLGEEGDEIAEEGDEIAEDGDEIAEDAAEEEVAEDAMEEDVAAESQPVSTGAITINSPADGARQTYDETQGPAIFSWEGPADRIFFSRSASTP